MLRISKLSDYAIMVMVALCDRPGTVASAQSLAERTHLELPTVSKVLKLLGRAGLVDSFRGVNGGYRVDREAAEVSVAEIITAIEGPIAMTECSIEDGLCSVEHLCSLRENWQRISDAVARAIGDVSLAEMTRPRPPEAAGLQIAVRNA
ncbi:MAG: SUF system Fe-S cluster assembly regulator [Xanthomonadales bacterium]|nr:SUF system Fe-S cluster assembly regulator [Xanthomonadales bacterium]